MDMTTIIFVSLIQVQNMREGSPGVYFPTLNFLRTRLEQILKWGERRAENNEKIIALTILMLSIIS
ncbi:MAG: hypothetical protein ACJA2S_001194 [Cyclobacteriaceae bacterium]|jgi:hypothetical protein